MATLGDAFEGKAREAFLDQAEHELAGKRDNLAFQFVEKVHERLRSYGERLDYNVESVIESLEYEDITRTDTSVSIKIGWGHKAAAFFEFGTSDHVITPTSADVLRFVWESRHDPPDWVKEEFEQARVPAGGSSGGQFRSGWVVFLPEVEVAGIQKIRQVRSALQWFRREVGR